ncbi:hypothetical protein F0U59_08765 [Archangium gephyra]|nr:hypothetical protein F0U59_08765 [Archangium gephyra]
MGLGSVRRAGWSGAAGRSESSRAGRGRGRAGRGWGRAGRGRGGRGGGLVGVGWTGSGRV